MTALFYKVSYYLVLVTSRKILRGVQVLGGLSNFLPWKQTLRNHVMIPCNVALGAPSPKVILKNQIKNSSKSSNSNINSNQIGLVMIIVI